MWAALIPAAASLVGGALAQQAAGSAAERAQRAIEGAGSLYGGLEVPELSDQMAYFQALESMGELEPILQQLTEARESELAGYTVDPRLAEQQMKALEQVSGIAEGKLPTALAEQLELSRRASARERQAQDAAILQQMQQRGIGGGGAELAARLGASQASAEQQAMQDLAAAQQQKQEAIQAMLQRGQMAGQMREQEFGETAQVAQAQDVARRFYDQMRAQQEAQNIATRMASQERNLSAKEKLAQYNAQLKQQQQLQHIAARQQQYQNYLQKAAGMSGAQRAMANLAQQQGAQQAGMYGQLGQGVGTLVSGAMEYFGDKGGTDKTTQILDPSKYYTMV